MTQLVLCHRMAAGGPSHLVISLPSENNSTAKDEEQSGCTAREQGGYEPGHYDGDKTLQTKVGEACGGKGMQSL